MKTKKQTPKHCPLNETVSDLLEVMTAIGEYRDKKGWGDHEQDR